MISQRGNGKQEVLGEGRHLRLVSRRGWEYAERVTAHGVVAVVGVTPEGELLLVEQHREAVGGTVLELPAGLAGDGPGLEEEALEEAARRELVEETGYSAARFERLSSGPPSAGLAAEVVTLLRAEDLRRVGPGGGLEGESIRVHRVRLESAPQWIRARERRGVLVDPKVWAGLWFVRGRA